jgi:hypothetical protein
MKRLLMVEVYKTLEKNVRLKSKDCSSNNVKLRWKDMWQREWVKKEASFIWSTLHKAMVMKD